MKILYLTSWLPFPLSTGAKVRNYYLLKYLSEKHQIDLLTFIFNREEEKNVSALGGICKRVKAVLAVDKKFSINEHVLAHFSEKPKSIQFSRNEEMAKLVYDWTIEKRYDLIIIDHIMMTDYVLGLKGIPRVIDHHNIDAVILERDYQLQKSSLKKIRRWLTWRKGLKYETGVSVKIEAHTFVSSVDKEIMMGLIPKIKLLEVVPNGVDLDNYLYREYSKNERSSPVIIYSSLLKYQANLNGLKYFHERIFPIIKASRPDIKLIVTGDYINLPVRDLQDDKNIEFVGYVDDVKKEISKAGVTIVPLQVGSGTRFKILESMAIGIPVVSTSIGAEGIDGLRTINSSMVHDCNIWIADDPEDFAKGVLALLSDRDLAGILSKNGRKLIEEKYGWDNIGKKMDEFIEKVVKGV
ncbi:MAG: glycosyltransferase family 4 protein [bacterium]|nr:glycosyltransferase family 4 protein [bacterium]